MYCQFDNALCQCFFFVSLLRHLKLLTVKIINSLTGEKTPWNDMDWAVFTKNRFLYRTGIQSDRIAAILKLIHRV